MSNLDQFPYDENGKEHGEWVSYYGNGNLWYRGNWIHGVRHGLHEVYSRYAKLDYRGYYNMGSKSGYWYWDGQKIYYLNLI